MEYANIHNEGGVVNPKVTDKMHKFAWYKVYSLVGIRKGSKKKGLDMYCWVVMMLTRCCGIFEGMEGDVKKKILYSNK